MWYTMYIKNEMFKGGKMKNLIQTTESFVNEEKGIVHTKVSLYSTILGRSFDGEGQTRLFTGDVFDEEFGKRVSTMRAVRTAHKLYRNALIDYKDRIAKVYFEVDDIIDKTSAKIDSIEEAIYKLVDSKRV